LHRVVPEAAEQAIRAIAAIHQVVAAAAVEGIAILAAAQPVVAAAAEQAVESLASVQGIVAGVRLRVAAVRIAEDVVAAGRAAADVRSICPEDVGH
jgi:hypothetical protein